MACGSLLWADDINAVKIGGGQHTALRMNCPACTIPVDDKTAVASLPNSHLILIQKTELRF